MAARRILQAPSCSCAAQQQQLPSHLQHARSMAVVVDVQRNNVDRALSKLNKHFKEAGMVEECRSREYRRTSAELKFARNRAAHNKRVGVQISERLKWVVRRRKLKM
uniref:30S ribosomal protein S21 n=1 Tax=Tetradesmus obliquus TaxID=3088 RepID=A0A383V8Q7_TETOB|eukprot:jgi/Sobl393_1/3485/SZX60974.1